MKLLLTADWHLSDNPRDAHRWTAVETILNNVVDRERPDHVFVLGDLTDFPDHHSARFTNNVVDMLADFSAVCPITIIRGNHDGSDPQVPFFRFINRIPKCSFLTIPMAMTLPNGSRVALIPHGSWPDVMPEVDLILTHNTFAGVKLENGVPLDGLRLPLTDIPIFSGDVHVPQTQGPVCYVGPPTHIRFGDNYQPRVLMLFSHTDKWAVRPIPINGPTKRLVELTVHPDGQFEHPNAPLFKGDIVKVRVAFAGGIPSLAKLRGDLQRWADSMGIKLHTVIPEIDNRRIALPATPVSRDDHDLVRQYASTRSFDKPTVAAGLAVVDKET